ncbi:MAG: gliding motility lipoprotein GldH [Saprospirales bacterium]|nr:gliding motility lipoprotein GldH [Saprospirales bacterium]MBK8493109.1 gliding motility lipoprotein GldH [Saprospirales bacterium]
MNKAVIGTILLTASVLFTACQPRALLNEKKSFAGQQWAHADTLDFQVAIKDTVQLYDLFLEVVHSPEFPNQNCYIRIFTLFPDGQRMDKLVSLELADKSGAWFGRCNSKSCRLTIPLQTGAYFNQPGDYLFTLEQYTRMDPLPGMQAMGMRIVPAPKKPGE